MPKVNGVLSYKNDNISVHHTNFKESTLNTPQQTIKSNEFTTQILRNYFISSIKPQTKLSFRGLPYQLNEYIPSQISGERALSIFDNFKLGNYLDLNGGAQSSEAKWIRKRNLAFLDKVTTEEDKRQFINGYCTLTGFPKMEQVSKNIQNEYVNACLKTQRFLQNQFTYYSSCYDIVGAGYDGVSSVSRNTAFPGSDMDKAYVILRGNDDDASNLLTVTNFKWRLWENTDQRLLSYNHDLSSFPEVYTLKQINAISDAINRTTETMNLHEKQQRTGIFGRTKTEPSKYDYYKSITKSFTDDYVQANQFIVDVASRFPLSNNWNKPIALNDLTREDIYKASFLLEAITKGKQLIGGRIPLTLNSDSKDLLNLSQIDAIKSCTTPKEKYKKRLTLEQDFPSWDTNKQFEFIKSMIKASCSDNTEFPDYYKSAEVDRYNVLLRRLGLPTND